MGDVFVGREREMAELQASLEETCAGRGRLLLLVGEPGIGKTRTAHELATSARLQGARVLIGRCYEGGGAPPFWPWVQIVRSYVRKSDPQTLVSEMGRGAADIAQIIAEVREQLPDLSSPPVLEPEQARFRFFDSLTTFLKNAGKAQPVVLILDDLQWADKPSLLLLQFLARELWDAYLLVVGTCRDVELGRQHSLLETLAELARVPGSQRLLLRGLAEQDVARFIEIATGLKPSEALLSAVYTKTEGNPFFLNEIGRLLATDGRFADPKPGSSWSFALPQSVRDVIGRRLNTLSQACDGILAIASVVGREFDTNVLERVSGTAGDQLLEVLEEAMAARVITEVPDSVGRYSFSHVLIRETLYEELTTVRRLRLHRRIGEVLEELYGAKLQSSASRGQILAELAYNFFEGARGGGDVEKAIDYAAQAGEQAMTLLAYEEATNHYNRALQALDLKEPGDETRRCQLLLALGEAQNSVGDRPSAKETFQRAAYIARELRSPELLAQAALGFGERIVIGMANEFLTTLLEEALDALGEGASALHARVLSRLAMELYYSDSVERRALLSQQAVEMARRVGDTAALAYALSTRHWAIWGPENVEERLAVATEVVQLTEESGDKVRALVGHLWRLTDLLELGDIPGVDVEIKAYTQLAEELRQLAWLWQTAELRAMRALMEGQFEKGEQLAQQALAIGHQARSQNAVQAFGVQMFALRREQGRLQELEAAIKGFTEQYPEVPGWRVGLAYIYSELGREAEARSEFEYLAANDFADLRKDPMNWLLSVTFLARVCALLNDSRRAETLYRLLLPYAGRNVVSGIATVSNGSASHSIGLLAATLARWEEALQHFEDALAMNVRMGAKPWVAHTQHDYAAALLTRNQPGDREKALGLLEAALALYQELGMQKYLERAAALKLQAQGPVDLSTPADAVAPTPQEQQSDQRFDPPVEGFITERPQSEPNVTENVFRRDGEYWTLTYRGTVCRLKDAKGLHYIAFLLRHEGQEVCGVELVAAVNKRPATPTMTSYSTLNKDLPEHNLNVGGLGDAGVVLDAQAKAAYKCRLAELQEELEEAQRFNDPVRATKAQAELEALTDELAAAVGLSGRDRKASSAAERARLNVTKAIKAALSKIANSHPALGHHLTTSIKTGIFCSYLPDPTQPTGWTL